MIREFINWLRWVVKLKTILPKEVGTVSHRTLTQEEKDYAEGIDLSGFYEEVKGEKE